MENDFFELSKNVANKFIQSVVFIDDKAYELGVRENAFDAQVVSNEFATTGKVCAIYAPKKESDINNYYPILDKADVIILDWRLDLEKDVKTDLNPEDDAEVDDTRGEYTIKIIKDQLKNSGNQKLKLIIIYTGDTISAIKDVIEEQFADYSFDKETYSMQINNLRLFLRGKGEDGEKPYDHNPELKQFLVRYDELPKMITSAFATMTSGLVSNFALEAITIIRDNTSRILGAFSPSLDPAYLGHKVMIPNAIESKNLLIQILGDAITELMESCNITTSDWVNKWIDSNIVASKFEHDGFSINITPDMLKNLIASDKHQLLEKLNSVGWNISEKKLRKIQQHIPELFICNEYDIDKANDQFAILTHHKNIFKPLSESPILTLGTVICSKSEQYYICIQQRCDSQRIKDERRFLFLPLSQSGEYPIIVENGNKLFPDKKSYELKTIKFKPAENDGPVRAYKEENGSFVFISSHNEKYRWIVDIKNMHAQRIVNNYCAQLSRVGLNESEWLRLYK